jgi:hypothetical protein
MIEVEVDHSAIHGPARHQGYVRPTCMAFTASDLNDAAHGCGHLSVEFLCHHAAQLTPNWSAARGFTLDTTLAALALPGQPAEASYPYMPDSPQQPKTAPPAGLAPLYVRNAPERNLSPERLIAAVREGTSVGLVVSVSQSLYSAPNGLIHLDPMAIPGQYHALIAVGLGKSKTTGELHVRVRNSWGDEWGDAGHAWMPEKHLRLHLHEAFKV